jgi:hypothetical protein
MCKWRGVPISSYSSLFDSSSMGNANLCFISFKETFHSYEISSSKSASLSLLTTIFSLVGLATYSFLCLQGLEVEGELPEKVICYEGVFYNYFSIGNFYISSVIFCNLSWIFTRHEYTMCHLYRTILQSLRKNTSCGPLSILN